MSTGSVERNARLLRTWAQVQRGFSLASCLLTRFPPRLPVLLPLVLLGLVAALCSGRSARAAGSICASVKIEIAQELTLERQGFDAHMLLTNGLDTASLDGVAVQVLFSDADANPVTVTSDPKDTSASFFIRLDTLDGISAVDGSASLAPASSAEIHWLIIPAPGAAGALPSGKLYLIGAQLSYSMAGEAHTLDVTPDSIYVKPLPALSLDYFLTREVYGDDAFTPQIEPPVPFNLGVRVRNNGLGTARQVAIDSAQPQILANDQGLATSFSILGASLDDRPASPSLLMELGDIAPEECRVGRWVMETSLSGRFVDFTASYSHADELGGAVTSLIDGVQTHALVRDVRVDLPGRDATRDFLAQDDDVYRVYESQGTEAQVTDVSVEASLSPAGSDGSLSLYRVSFPPRSGLVLVHLPDPSGGTQAAAGATRSDGKAIPADNLWMSKSRAPDNSWRYQLNLFDSDTPGSYLVRLGEPMVGPQPPQLQPIADRVTYEGKGLSFQVQANDPDGTHPRLSAAPLPFGAQFSDRGDGTAMLSWTPIPGQAGVYAITYQASDGTLQASRTARIRVNPAWDTDGDGMDDAWELAHFGTLARDGSGDFDGDGVSDLQEYLGQRDPTAAEGPDDPWVQSPLYNATATEATPHLSVFAVPSLSELALSYAFELLDDAGSRVLQSVEGLAAGPDGAAWSLPAGLADNQWYRWRARTTDGSLYSLWTPGRFRLNTTNDPPSIPLPELPDANAVVGAPRPLIGVLPAADPDGDALSYRFVIARDVQLQDLVAQSPVLAAAGDVPVRWSANVDLGPGVSYYWQAVVSDGQAQSVSAVRAFSVDASDADPASGALIAPVPGKTLSVSTADLKVANGQDPEGAALSYHFELDTQADFAGTAKQVSPALAQGDGATVWTVSGLQDNQSYYWRARPDDGARHGPWVYGRFRVNTENQPPGPVLAANPGAGAWVKTQQPELAVYPAADPDGDALSYEYEIYDAASPATLVASIGGAGESWRLESSLADNHSYLWRTRALDPQGAAGPWSESSRFFVNDNGVDDIPQIAFTYPRQPIEARDALRLYWADEDADSSAQIELLYSTDPSGAGAQNIGQGLAEDAEGAGDYYAWDLSALPGGDYYLGARISDGSSSTSTWNAVPITHLTDHWSVEVDRTQTSEAGGSVTLSLHLDNAPQDQVVLALSSSNPAEGQVSPTSLTITPEDWQLIRRVSVTGVDDHRVDGDQPYQIRISAAASADVGYAQLQPLVVGLTNLDDDYAGLAVSPTQGATDEQSASQHFDLVLTSEPAAPVSFDLSVSAPREARVEPTAVTFTPQSWDRSQGVDVTGLDDAIDDGDVSYTLQVHPGASTDPDYQGLDPADPPLVNRDDDTAGLQVSAPSGPTSEAGGSAGFSIRLASQPLAQVRLSLASSDPGEGLVSPGEVVIDPQRWDVPVSLMATGVDDFVDDGDVGYSIQGGPSTSEDAKYAGLVMPEVHLSNLDNDTAGILVSPLQVATSESGDADVFDIRLTSQPLAPVSIGLSSSDPGEAVALPDTLVIGPGQWSEPHQVIVYGVNDQEIDGYQDYAIVTAPAQSADPLYAGRDASDVRGSNSDDEPDTIAPQITLIGAPALYVELGGVYVDPGATAYDVPEGDLTADILTTNPVDTTRPSSYRVSYEVSDSAGNAAQPVYRQVSVIDENLPPAITLSATQMGIPTRLLYRWGGPVLVQAQITDVNCSDTHRLDWSASHPALLAAAVVGTDALTLDLAGLVPGFYKVRIKVTDSGLPARSNRAELLLQVIDSPPALGAEDHDGDGLPDQAEGYGDSDADGVPEYLDARTTPGWQLMVPSVRAPAGALLTDAYLHPGLGDIAFAATAGTGPVIDAVAIAQYGSGEGGAPAASSTDAAGSGVDTIDVQVRGAAVLDDQVSLIWPLRRPVPENALLRLFDSERGWYGFVADGDNRLASAPAPADACPPAGDTLYRNGLNPGDGCLSLTVRDEGPDDQAAGRIYEVAVTAALIGHAPGQVVLVPDRALPGDTLELIGTGFGAKTGQVKIGGKAAKVLAWSDTSILLETPNLTAGTYPVEIKLEKSDWVEGAQLRVPALHIEQISKVFGGNRVEILGSGFGAKAGGSVRIGDTDVTNILEWTDRHILIELPALLPGVYDVRVKAFNGSDEVPSGLTLP